MNIYQTLASTFLLTGTFFFSFGIVFMIQLIKIKREEIYLGHEAWQREESRDERARY